MNNMNYFTQESDLNSIGFLSASLEDNIIKIFYKINYYSIKKRTCQLPVEVHSHLKGNTYEMLGVNDYYPYIKISKKMCSMRGYYRVLLNLGIEVSDTAVFSFNKKDKTVCIELFKNQVSQINNKN